MKTFQSNTIIIILFLFLAEYCIAQYTVSCNSCAVGVGAGTISNPYSNCSNVVSIDISGISLTGSVTVFYSLNGTVPNNSTITNVVNSSATISETLVPGSNPNKICIDSIVGNNSQTLTSTTNCIFINANVPTPVQITGNIQICLNSPTVLSANNTFQSYLWSTTSTNQSISVTPTVNTTYTLMVTDVNGCESASSKQVIVLPLPVISASSNSPVCEGGLLQFTGSAGTSHNWTSNNFSSTSQNPAISNVQINANGTYVYSVTSNNGCSASTSISVVINSKPISTATSNSPLCENDNLMLNGNGGSTYLWSGPNNFTSTLKSPTIANVQLNGSGTYSCIVTNTNMCSSPTTTLVTVHPKPIATITSNSPLCVGANLLLTGIGGATYSWKGPNNFISVLQNPTIENVTSAATGSYTLTVTDNNSCKSQKSINVTINPLPILSFGNFDNTVCIDADPFSIIILPQGGTFTSNSSGVSSSGIFNPELTGEGIIAYNYTFVNNNNCASSLSNTITVFTLPSAQIAVNDVSGIPSDDKICLGEIATLVGMPSGTAFKWSGPQVNNNTNTTLDVSPSTKATYTLQVTDSNGCKDTATKMIDVNRNPKADFIKQTNFDPLKYGQPFNLINTSELSPDAITNFYNWSFSPDNVINLLGNQTNATSLFDLTSSNTNGLASENVMIKLNIEDNNGCKHFKENVLRLSSTDCFAQQLFDESIIYCVGDQITLNFNITVSSGAVLTQCDGFMILGSLRIPVVRDGNSTNFKIDAITHPIILNTPGDWIFELIFSDNNVSICNGVKNQYSVKIEQKPIINWQSSAIDTICDEAKSLNINIGTNFASLKFNTDIQIKYNLIQNSVKIKEIIQPLTKSQTVLVVEYANILEKLLPGPFQIEIVEISNKNSKCSPITSSLIKNFQLLPPIEILTTEIECEDDSIFSAKITLTGGDGKFNLVRQVGIIDIDTINLAANIYRVFFTLSNYRLIVQGSKDFCNQKELNTLNLIRPSCDCDFVFQNIKSGSINVSNGVLFNNVFRICNGSAFKCTISNVKLEPTTDTLLLFATNGATTENQILKSAVKIFPSFTQNFSSYEASIAGLDPNVEYFIVAGVVQKNRNNPNGLENFDITCRMFTSNIRVYFNQTPSPILEIPQTKFCANESNIIVSAKNLVQKTIAGFSNSEYNWNLGEVNENIGFVTKIDSSRASLYLAGTDTTKTYSLKFTESITYPGDQICTNTSFVNITTSNSVAPDTASIIYWPGNILVCTADSADVLYKWGYTDHTKPSGTNDVFIANATLKYLINNSDILNNIEKQTYFVDLKSRKNVQNKCNTRIYFTGTEALERAEKSKPIAVSIYPNPTNGTVSNIHINSKQVGIYNIQIYDVNGVLVSNFKVIKTDILESFPINQNLANGHYFIRVRPSISREYVSKHLIINN